MAEKHLRSYTSAPNISSEDRWNKAFNKLKHKDAREFKRLDQSDCLTILKQVEASATNKKSEADKKAMNYTRRDGTSVFTRDLFGGVLQWVQKFREVGSVIASYDPGHVALPWAAVQFLLEVAIQGSLVYEITAEGVETISKMISQCSYMEQLFLQRVSGDESGFEDALLDLYVAILKFESYTIRYYLKLRGRCKLLAPLVLPAKRFRDYLDNIFVARTEQRETILNWLSKEVQVTHHLRKQNNRLKGSCQWLLNSKEYTEWRWSSLSSIFWLSGIAGSGKSFLVSSVIDDLQRNPQLSGANGRKEQPRFRWADLQLDQLCSDAVNVEKDIDDFLGNLPKSLEESYDLVYNKIMRSGLASQKVATMTFQVLLNAQRILTSDEMLAAVSIDLDLDLDLEKMDILASNDFEILSVCRNLVVFDNDISSGGSYRFAHQSVREYLVKRTGTEFTTLHTEIFLMERCLCVFLLKSQITLAPKPMLTERIQSILELNESFINYATEFWITHCRLAQSTKLTSEMLKVFIGIHDTYSNGFMEWKQSLSLLKPRGNPPLEWMLSIRKSSSPLFVACLHGLTGVVKALLSHKSTDWNELSELEVTEDVHVWSESEAAYQYYPLEIAASRGYMEIVRQFLAEPYYARCNTGQTIGTRSLYAAIRGSHQELTKMLLEYGVDTNGHIRGDTCLNFCCRAVKEGKSGSLSKHYADARLFGQEAKDAMAMLLLEHHADVNLPNQDSRTPLEISIEHEATNIAKALIERDAKLPARIDSVLRAAIKSGDVALLQALRTKLRVNFAQRDSDGSTLLRAALKVIRPSRDVIQFLLDAGIDIGAVDRQQRTALHIAVHSKEYVTPVTCHTAVSPAFLSAVTFLLDKGVPIDAEDCRGGTALRQAEMVHYLPEAGNINDLDEDDDPHLNHPLINLLLSRAKIKTNIQNSDRETPEIRSSLSPPLIDRETNTSSHLRQQSVKDSAEDSANNSHLDNSESTGEIEDGEWITETHTLLNMRTLVVRRRRI
ncbi:hypothetical protein SBOR_5492 [Sclerotinia borealis F-4128]|uniref:Uncharacterized protein n=1 Tax=Sclerotinia borealis (strain F-4128) TaxID=1432307 RepID=W9CE57_SCLBF|nr:hypothetical protein SBOR_5492 [Sclerotinia borealis F-4128]